MVHLKKDNNYQINLHVHVDLLVTDLLLGLHDDPDVVKVVDGPVQLPVEVHHLEAEVRRVSTRPNGQRIVAYLGL